MHFLLLSCFVLNAVVSTAATCPSKCYCTATYVKCMLVPIQHVPKDLDENTTILDLRFNEIKELQDDSFADTTEIETLLLNNNRISILRKGIFNGLKKLHILHLHKNNIQSIEEGTFDNLSELQQLYLHYNNISVLQKNVFNGLTNLSRLFLHSNNLVKLSLNTFLNLPAIKNVRLDGNRIACNCEVIWMVDWLMGGQKKVDVQLSGLCNEPEPLRGKALPDLITDLTEFKSCIYPKFVIEPKNIHIDLSKNTSTLLSCIAVGFPKPNIYWRKNGLSIDLKNKKYKQTHLGLIIDPLIPTDEGSYECVASNDQGEIKSRSIELKLINKIVTENLGNLTGSVSPSRLVSAVGDRVQFDCEVQGRNDIKLTWIKNTDFLIENPPKIKILGNGSLVFEAVEIYDAGEYYCISEKTVNHVFGSSELIVNAAPKFLTSLSSSTIGAGTSVDFHCVAVGYPLPVYTWYLNGKSVVPNSRISLRNQGTILHIENVQEHDSGMYTCLAQNRVGTAESNGELRVKNRGPRAPKIIIGPFDMDVPQYSGVEIPCKNDGEPKPNVLWFKNNQLINIDKKKFRTSTVGSLRIYNISVVDSGIYECTCSNIYGNDTAKGTLTVFGDFLSESDEHILQAFQDAKLEIDRAINATVSNLFSMRNASKSPAFLMKLIRYPDQVTRNLVKPADIYTRTLVNARKHILTGLKLNLSADAFSYNEILSPSQLDLIANLSGCVTHQPNVNCSDTKFHSKYSALDGTCNNLEHPMWGASFTAFRRILKPVYENGFSTPVGWNPELKYHGFKKPQARFVSTTIIRTYNITADEEITHMVMQWGQFLDHDLDHSLPSTTAESWEGLDCKKTCAYSEPCFPMEIPANDTRIHNRRCMDFIRTSAVCGSGDTSVFFDGIQPRQQINQLTSYIDATQVYGFSRDRSFLLRDLRSDWGLLRGGLLSETNKLYLPTAGATEVDCRRDLVESETGCFLAGDIRVNEQVGLIAMHTIWLREHNRIANELRELNSHWLGETLYFEARKIVIAQMQHITYDHWLQHVLGPEGLKILGPYKGYNATVDATISNVFATAALRFGHTIINPELARLDRNFKTIPQGNLPLGKAFFAPWRLIEEGGVDPLMRGLFATAAKLKKPSQNLNDQLIDELFTAAHAVSLDLAAMNIQRARDHGLPGYNEYRKFCGLPIATDFKHLPDITDEEVRQKLERLYGHPGNIDVWVGGILEDQSAGAKVGPLFRCLLAEQFKRLRDGDRFWFENPITFNPAQLKQIKSTSLARILCDNGDDINQITENVFILPKLQNPHFVPCSNIPYINLEEWRNCEAGCNKN